MRLLVSAMSLACAASTYSWAATTTDLGAASGQVYNRSGDTSSHESQSPQRVRIPLTLKTWNEVKTTETDGKTVTSQIAGRPLTHVLRARIERANDFYLGDWRIQTTPVRWLKNSNQYQVRLEVFRRYGETGQLEENLGSVTLTGLLEKQEDGLFVLNGTARRVFRNRVGQPILDLDAGQHSTIDKGTAISRR